MGWPMATEPPLTLARSGGRAPSSRMTAMACTLKASLSSKRSTESMDQPARARTFCTP